MNNYTFPPINLYNFWIYNRLIREYDDNTIYREWIDAKVEEFLYGQEELGKNFEKVLFDNIWDLYQE